MIAYYTQFAEEYCSWVNYVIIEWNTNEELTNIDAS